MRTTTTPYLPHGSTESTKTMILRTSNVTSSLLLTAIIANPGSYYSNLLAVVYPNGAMRGQLFRHATSERSACLFAPVRTVSLYFLEM